MPGRSTKLEVCVDTIVGLLAAKAGGADQVELCSSLAEGGLTPSAGLMQAAAEIGMTCHVMIRPRAGDFRYSPQEVDVMLHDIAAAQQFGHAGVVLGAENAEGALDLNLLDRLVAASEGLDKTLHRVVDVVADRTDMGQVRSVVTEKR